jgi:hypothetical protein
VDKAVTGLWKSAEGDSSILEVVAGRYVFAKMLQSDANLPRLPG